MAVFETWLKSDLQKAVQVKSIQGNLFSADNAGNLIGVVVTDGGSPAEISGNVTAYIIRADGATVVAEGSISGNRVSVTLPASAYAVVGQASIVIKVGTTTVGACTVYVYRSTTDTIVDPGEVIPSITELLEKIDEMEQGTAAANSAAQNANEKATLANTAASKIDNMTVAASELPEGSSPTAQISEVSGHKHIAFGIPKVDKIGFAPDLIAGTAEQLMSSDVVEDAVPYLYRKSGGGLDIGNREKLEKVVGGTVAWNQYLPDEARSNTNHGVTYTRAEKSPYVLSGTATGGNAVFVLTAAQLNAQVGHKYLMLGGVSSDIYVSLSTTAIWGNANPQDKGGGKIANAVADGKFDFVLLVTDGASAEGKKVSAQLFDLTQMFGSTIADAIYAMEQANAGAGVAWFRKLFPDDYYPYNAGELISISGLQSHDMVGFNQWDEEWEVGTYNISTGEKKSSSLAIRSKNFIPVVPNSQYYFVVGSVSGAGIAFICCYNENHEFIELKGAVNRGVFTTASNCKYITFGLGNDYGTTYNHDICISLSGSRNGEYEPYVKHSYPLDSSLTLRGIPKMDAQNNLYFDGDEYLPDGNVKRKYGIVDLGTLTWTYFSTANHLYFKANLVNPKRAQNGAKSANLLCASYTNSTGNDVYANTADKLIAIPGDNDIVMITNFAYTDAATFKTDMSGVMLVYELATPTTETAEPYTAIQICSDWGTEEFVTGTIVPVGHETRYPANLVKKLEGLPWNFSSLIAPTEETTTASRAYTAGSYLIYQNTLYKVTSAIASGGTITPGTNVTATTIMAELIALA